MTCLGNARETLRRRRWQKLVGKAREGHNKWRADTRGTYGGGCKYRAEQTCSVSADGRSSWERQEKDIISGGQARRAGTAGVASTEQSRHECQQHLHKLDTASHLVAFIRPRWGIQDKGQPSVGQTRMA